MRLWETPEAAVASQRVSAADVYFTPQYGAAMQAAGSGRWMLLTDHDSAWQLPFHLRDEHDVIDAVSPYGYSGLYVHSGLSVQEAAESWANGLDALRDLGAVSLVLRQSPLFPDSVPELHRLSVVRDHKTVCVDTLDASMTWSNMSASFRNMVRKSNKHGLVANIRFIQDGDLNSGSDFCRLYENAMLRNDADEFYFFPREYYDQLSDGLGENLLIGEVRDSFGNVRSSCLLMRHETLLHYHLAGSQYEFARLGANNALLWSCMQWASENGIKRFHLGGGVKRDDGLFKFKKASGGHLLNYQVYGFILDQGSYDKAMVEVVNRRGGTLEEFKNTSYFPAFRKPK
jgi:hypothetical protein